MSATAAPAQEETFKKVHNILISQPKPAQLSAYNELEKRFGVRIDFVPFVTVEGLTEKEYRKKPRLSERLHGHRFYQQKCCRSFFPALRRTPHQNVGRYEVFLRNGDDRQLPAEVYHVPQTQGI